MGASDQSTIVRGGDFVSHIFLSVNNNLRSNPTLGPYGTLAVSSFSEISLPVYMLAEADSKMSFNGWSREPKYNHMLHSQIGLNLSDSRPQLIFVLSYCFCTL